jgi:hypothetical protein
MSTSIEEWEFKRRDQAGMRPASATDGRQRCGIGLEMTKALVAP